MSNAVTTEQEWKPSGNPWLLILPVMLATFMYALDETVANVALPHIAGSYSVSSQESIWVLTSYLMASSIVIPMIDYFCKLLGRRNYFILSVLIFTIASFMCGISSSIGMIVIARALQGFGGGCLIPLSQAITMESFKGDSLNKAMAVFGLVVVVAPILGPVMGGWITDNWAWPWIFFINVPFGLIVVLLAKKYLEDPPYAKRQKNTMMDKWGFFWLCVWLIPLQVVFDKGNDKDWFGSTFICWLTAIAVVGGIAFFVSQVLNKKDNAFIKFDVLKDVNFVFGTIMLIMSNAILLASLAILPQMLQYLLGYDAFTSGLSIMPRGVGAFLSLLIFGAIGGRVPYKIYAVIGFFCLGLGGWMLGHLNLEISQMNIVIPNFIFGIGLVFSMMPLVTLSCITLRNEQMTNASGFQNLLKTIGGSIGTSLVATFISRFSQMHQYMMVKSLTPTNNVYAERLSAYAGTFTQYVSDSFTGMYMAQTTLYNQMLQQCKLWAYMDSFRIFAVGCFILIPILFLMKGENRKAKQ